MQTDSLETMQVIERLAVALKTTRATFSTAPPDIQHLPPSPAQFQRWLKQIEDQRFHSNQTFTVMVLGEYNAGKSTLLNALLELPAELRLPSGDDPVTGKPLRLRYTDKVPHALLLMNDGTTRPDEWKKAVNQADQRLTPAERNTRRMHMEQVKEVQLFLRHPLLTNTDILDMPGTGTAEFEEHTQLTRDYLDNVEMIIWVIGETEPSSEGARDFRKALRTQAPITVVFNAWGSIRNTGMEIDQDALEQGVLNKFSEIQEDPFSLYARKCLETQDGFWKALKLPSVFSAGLTLPDMLTKLQQQQGYKEAMDQYGLHLFKDFLWENYLEHFDEHRMKVREQAMATTIRVAEQVRAELEEAQKSWHAEMSNLEGENKRLTQYTRKLAELKNRVSLKIKALADPYTQEITDIFTQKLNMFIEDKVKPSNPDVWQNVLDQTRLKAILEEQLKTEYLFVNQPNNVFTVEAQNFVEEACMLLKAEWLRFLSDIELEMEQAPEIGQHQLDIDGVLERITNEAMAAVQQTIMQIVTSLAALALIIFGSLLALLFLLIAAPFGFKAGPSPQEKAKKRVRDEISGQYRTIKKKLTDIILSPTGIYGQQERAFQKSIGEDRSQNTKQMTNLQFGSDKLKQLSQEFDFS